MLHHGHTPFEEAGLVHWQFPAHRDRLLGAIVLEMAAIRTRQRYPLLPRWPGYPGQGDFIGIIGNWRSLHLGRAVLRGFRKNKGLPARVAFPALGWTDLAGDALE